MYSSVVQPPVLNLFSSSATYALQPPLFEVQADTALPEDSFVCSLDDQTSLPLSPGAILLAPDPQYRSVAHRILHIQSPTLRKTYLRCPAHGSKGLGIKLPWLHLQVRNLEREWSFEVGLVDGNGKEGRVRFSTFQEDAKTYPSDPPLLHIPFRFPEMTSATRTLWTTVDVHLPPLLKHLSSTAPQVPLSTTDGHGNQYQQPLRVPFSIFSHASYVKVYANCRLRRIWFSTDGDADGPVGAWELKLYAAEESGVMPTGKEG
ncbi:hypothetical protein FRB96_005355 [Tulasnella sp. 330]|nr:hypothetical protein FRB96_005355 [Tulasnella sp. 330]KAG8869378.1 hypothetical protein FRB97_001276 [Tulasnella sp. 331]KAG8870857.1 hypothetical protein FRB98_001301 [Tulasnella sp. 332]